MLNNGIECPRCKNKQWEEPNKERHPLIFKAWGEEVKICHRCGLVLTKEEYEKEKEV